MKWPSFYIRGIKGEPVSIGEMESYIFEKAQEQGIKLKDIINTNKKLQTKKTVKVVTKEYCKA